ncbi:hypothetical protein B0F90DRAFT_1608773, partial [Multifurca ochricompacta]
THELHRGDIPYEAPSVRSVSPNDSLTTAYGPDETNLSDRELSEDAFANKALADLRIYEKREEEERAETRPLIMPRPRRGATNSVDEKAMVDQVMRSLRWHINQLEEQDGIETVLQRRVMARPETPPLANDVDIIMESMM